MARETKVGLLAGLAFIICFAVILSNRGDQEPFSTAGANFPIDLQGAGHGATGLTGVPYAAAPKPSAVLQPSLPYPATPVQIVGAEHPFAPPGAGTASVIPDSIRFNADARGEGDHLSAVGHSPMIQASRPAHASENGLPPVVQSPGTENGVAKGVPAAAAPQTSNGGASPNAPPVPAPQRGQPPPSPSSKKYTVSPGDTLSKIAASQYGSKSTTLVDVIFDANRGVLKERDVLPAGVELILPEWSTPKPTASRNPLAPSPIKTPTRPAEVTKAPPKRIDESRLYQVKKGDRFFSIARDQLGDGSRWREIFELNKDRIPDPGMIREGDRIRLPVAMTALGRDRKQ